MWGHKAPNLEWEVFAHRLIDRPPERPPDEVDVTRKTGTSSGERPAGSRTAARRAAVAAATCVGAAAAAAGARGRRRGGAALARHTIGPQQQVDQLTARAERVGDRGAGVERDGGPQLAADLGHEHFASWRGGAVERG